MTTMQPQAQFNHTFAGRMLGAGTEDAFVVLAEAKRLEAEGRSIIHLQIGEPDFDTPRNIIDKAHWAVDNHYTHYTGSAGLRDVREKYAEYVCQQYRVSDIGPEHIVVYPGAKPIVFLSTLMLIDPGDEVIIFDPVYPAYAAAAQLMGAEIRHLPLSEDTGFRFDHDQLRKLVTNKTKLFY